MKNRKVKVVHYTIDSELKPKEVMTSLKEIASYLSSLEKETAAIIVSTKEDFNVEEKYPFKKLYKIVKHKSLLKRRITQVDIYVWDVYDFIEYAAKSWRKEGVVAFKGCYIPWESVNLIEVVSEEDLDW